MLSSRHGVCPLKTAGVKLTRSSEACCMWKSLQSLSLHVSHQNRFNLFWEVLNTGPLLFCYMHQYMLWNTSCHSYSIKSISLYIEFINKIFVDIIHHIKRFNIERRKCEFSFKFIFCNKYLQVFLGMISGGKKSFFIVYKEERAWKYFTTIDVRFGIVYSVLYLMCAYTCNKIS